MLGQSHFKFWSKKVNEQRSTVRSGRVNGWVNGRVGSDRSNRFRPVKPVETGQTGQNRLKTDTYNDRFKFLNGGELDFKSAESLTAPPPHAPPSTADKVDTGELGTAQGTRWCGRCRKRSNDQRIKNEVSGVKRHGSLGSRSCLGVYMRVLNLILPIQIGRATGGAAVTVLAAFRIRRRMVV
ncbi:hypothetical protein F3Y22_tig00110187pilonHSYRG00418 [Hibiscus syriacus]|uniref:Uncharacterized protein n=1 Tax=Hibiscus syriacus TaxID=106335 RepID=A0A6A3BG07_HIBSY|nr:hypothetical protein F3Y22_tig00110187pilonHSYRG00418 [Hibiscus syriacus]